MAIRLYLLEVAEGKPQLFLLSLNGGEAIQLTRFKYGAGNPKFSPDGKQIIFLQASRLETCLMIPY
jgi:Tol biopolymer transport system component